ncbi:hypothetical protein DEO72_LG7g1197 [Vigna unguiculata]|uniref:Secreted protein n=1 Tax=Vigna unguiculata TaxID=3917 RepID=A0A4D6MGQ0_VIGUN|nr:hypothetical protein DEO72_LG7g1197 [Vigna unguiculata]
MALVLLELSWLVSLPVQGLCARCSDGFLMVVLGPWFHAKMETIVRDGCVAAGGVAVGVNGDDGTAVQMHGGSKSAGTLLLQ